MKENTHYLSKTYSVNDPFLILSLNIPYIGAHVLEE